MKASVSTHIKLRRMKSSMWTTHMDIAGLKNGKWEVDNRCHRAIKVSSWPKCFGNVRYEYGIYVQWKRESKSEQWFHYFLNQSVGFFRFLQLILFNLLILRYLIAIQNNGNYVFWLLNMISCRLQNRLAHTLAIFPLFQFVMPCVLIWFDLI